MVQLCSDRKREVLAVRGRTVFQRSFAIKEEDERSSRADGIRDRDEFFMMDLRTTL